MFYRWGGRTSEDAEAWFSRQIIPQASRLGLREHNVVRWTINGNLAATSQNELQVKREALESSFSRQNDGSDLLFLDNDGSTVRLALFNNQTISGTRCAGLHYPGHNSGVWGSGTEWANLLTYQAIVEAEVVDTLINVVDWRESVELIGNGSPRWRMMGALTGPVQRQTLQQFTPYKVIQHGYAIGKLTYPVPAAPLWPQALHPESFQQALDTPQFGAVRNTNFPVRWRYVFESAVALVGGPTFIQI